MAQEIIIQNNLQNRYTKQVKSLKYVILHKQPYYPSAPVNVGGFNPDLWLLEIDTKVLDNKYLMIGKEKGLVTCRC